jgi:hypothetical protein
MILCFDFEVMTLVTNMWGTALWTHLTLKYEDPHLSQVIMIAAETGGRGLHRQSTTGASYSQRSKNSVDTQPSQI